MRFQRVNRKYRVGARQKLDAEKYSISSVGSSHMAGRSRLLVIACVDCYHGGAYSTELTVKYFTQ